MSEEVKKEKFTEENPEVEILEKEDSAKEENNNDELNVEIEKLKKENDELKAAYMRKTAEFQNYSKRKDKELEDFRKFASEKVIVKILEAADNLERGIAASTATKDFDSLVKGVEMTLGQVHNILNSEGVEAIISQGEEFNPYEHQAMMTEESEEHGHNTIIAEFQKGYKMKGKVIRPAMVKVAKNTK